MSRKIKIKTEIEVEIEVEVEGEDWGENTTFGDAGAKKRKPEGFLSQTKEQRRIDYSGNFTPRRRPMFPVEEPEVAIPS